MNKFKTTWQFWLLCLLLAIFHLSTLDAIGIVARMHYPFWSNLSLLAFYFWVNDIVCNRLNLKRKNIVLFLIFLSYFLMLIDFALINDKSIIKIIFFILLSLFHMIYVLLNILERMH